MLEYKGYSANFSYDEHEGHYYGMVIMPKGLVTFQSDTVEDVSKEFELSIDDYLSWLDSDAVPTR